MDDRANSTTAHQALEDAEKLIDRLQDVVAEQLPPDSGKSSAEAYGDLIAELETAPEIGEVREALGEKPHFGSAAHRRQHGETPPPKPSLDEREATKGHA